MDVKKLIPIVLLFILINILCFLSKEMVNSITINYNFILVVNTMLLITSIISHRIKSMDKVNANAMVRWMMLGTLFKMGVFAIAALIYAKTQNTKVGMSTLFISMGLYLIYTWYEIKWVTQKK